LGFWLKGGKTEEKYREGGVGGGGGWVVNYKKADLGGLTR